MTAKEFLKELIWINEEIEALQMQMLVLRSEAEGVKAMTISDMPKGGKAKDPSDIVVEIADLQCKCAEKMSELVERKKRATRIIMELRTTEHRVVLINRYLCMRRWEDIADKMGYSIRGIFKLHGQALVEFSKIYERVQ